MKNLIAKENIGGRTNYYYSHLGDDGKTRFTVNTVQDVEPIIERNKRLFNDASPTFGKESFAEVADIPANLIEQECHKIVANTGERFSDVYREVVNAKTDRAVKLWNRLLNDRDLRYFRTRPGKVDISRRA